MSKSGSRYGRRSNWFKIHCLLQEQQQAQAAATQNGMHKPQALSPNSINLMRHPSYSSNLFSRPPCTKEELMMLRLDEYAKQPTAASSPSISSPDSRNSDSSIEIGDKRNSQSSKHVKHAPNLQQHQPSPMMLNKDLFLPFAGFPLMPPPGFLPPPSHLLFSSYHNALYEHNNHLLQQQVQQGLLKTSDSPLSYSRKSPSRHREENFCYKKDEDDNDNDDIEEENVDIEKNCEKSSLRNFSNFSSSLLAKITKRSSSPELPNEKSDDEDIDMNESDDLLSLTPPRSPKLKRDLVESNPIDLSMKSGSSTKSDDNHNYYKTKRSTKSPSEVSTINVDNQELREDNNGNIFKKIRYDDSASDEKNHRHIKAFNDEDENYEAKLKSQPLAPLDLTRKVWFPHNEGH